MSHVNANFSERDAGDGVGKVRCSDLLNAIDGVMAQEGHLLFMTTNYVEHLNPALIRPSRIDVTLKGKVLDEEYARRMFLRFFPGEDAAANRFAETAIRHRPPATQANIVQDS